MTCASSETTSVFCNAHEWSFRLCATLSAHGPLGLMKASSFLVIGLLVVGCRQQSPAQTLQTSSTAVPSAATAGTIQPTILADENEPGARMEFWGRILDYQGRPLSEAAVVAHQTDSSGLYTRPDADSRIPRIRAVAITNENGAFRFSTIRPGAYPEGGIPEHIHLEITAPAHRLKWVTFWFDDDPILTPSLRNNLNNETVIVELSRDTDGTWTFSHDIRMEGN